MFRFFENVCSNVNVFRKCADNSMHFRENGTDFRKNDHFFDKISENEYNCMQIHHFWKWGALYRGIFNVLYEMGFAIHFGKGLTLIFRKMNSVQIKWKWKNEKSISCCLIRKYFSKNRKKWTFLLIFEFPCDLIGIFQNNVLIFRKSVPFFENPDLTCAHFRKTLSHILPKLAQTTHLLPEVCESIFKNHRPPPTLFT